jgi:UPF0755 protein
MLKKENGVSKILVVILVFILLVIIGIFGGLFWYNSNLQAIQKDSEKVLIVIEEGSGSTKIAEQLEENGLIKNATAFKIYCKLNESNTMQAGKYELDKNMTVEQIIEELQNGNVIDETVNITFIEGKNMRWIASTIANQTTNTEEDVYDLLEDEEYIDSLIEKYWFITDDIKDEDIYYSLEGYLYPDTYTLANENVSVEIIFEKMLDKMEEVLNPFKEEVEDSKYTVHELLTLASIVELEATNVEDRAEVAGVFYNRLKKGMGLQSDVTTYYGAKIDMGERDLTSKEITTANAYNTRSEKLNGKLPASPIAMISKESFEAVLEPKTTSAIFFVADKNGKVYFSNTNSEHEEVINELKEKGLWYTYDE